VRLPKNQNPSGWVTVVFKRHATELFQLSNEELAGFWREVADVSKAIHAKFSPVKIHYMIFGSICPHLHCHLVAKQKEDDPYAPIILGSKPENILDTTTRESICTDLKNILSSVQK